jgi:hypothetical protein
MTPLLTVIILLLCIVLVIINEMFKRRKGEEHVVKQGTRGSNGGTWLARALLIAVPLLWLLTLSFGGFDFIFDIISTPTGHIPGQTTGDVVPVPLHQFAIGGFLVLGLAVIAIDSYIFLRYLKRRLLSS